MQWVIADKSQTCGKCGTSITAGVPFKVTQKAPRPLLRCHVCIGEESPTDVTAYVDLHSARLPRPSAGVTIAARGGPQIWSMREAWMPSRCTCKTDGRAECLRHKGQEGLTGQMAEGADHDGFAVFGQFPHGWLKDVLRLRLLGDVQRDEILHVCSGTLGPSERWTVDIRLAARPAVVARGQALPFRDATFRASLIDPPYTEEYARNLYRSEFPRPSHLLREAARVVVPGGRIGLLHIAVPITPDGCVFVSSFGVVPGPGFRIRAFTVYERIATGLPFERPA